MWNLGTKYVFLTLDFRLKKYLQELKCIFAVRKNRFVFVLSVKILNEFLLFVELTFLALCHLKDFAVRLTDSFFFLHWLYHENCCDINEFSEKNISSSVLLQMPDMMWLFHCRIKL